MVCALANPWAQPNYDWKQQKASPYPGPKYLPYPSYQPIVQTSYYSNIVGAPSNGEIIYAVQTVYYDEANAYGTVQGINATTLEFLWELQVPSYYSSYQVTNPLVTTNGSLIVGVAPPNSYQQPSTRIRNIAQISSEGTVENFFTINEDQDVVNFILGPQNEILGYSNNQWYMVGGSNAGPFEGVPVACDDSGSLFVLNGTQLYKTSLSDPYSIQWNVCPGQEFCYSSVQFYVSQVSVSRNQSSLLVGVCRDFYDSNCFLVSLSIETGNSEWIYVIYEGPITVFSVAGDYIYINYGEYPMILAVLNSAGYSINTYFMNSYNFIGDANGVILMLNGTYYQPMILTTVGPKDFIASAGLNYNPCIYEDTSLFFTSIDTIWLYCTQQLGVIRLSLTGNEEAEALALKKTKEDKKAHD